MNAKHTPTPWRTGACITIIEHWPEGWNAPVRIADCHLKHGAPESPAERVANARLIAAAPDLLEACEAALTAFRRMYHDIEKGTIDIDDLMDDESYWPLTSLRDSIAKAKGE